MKNTTKETTITFRLSNKMKEELFEKAEEKGLSLSSYIIMILKENKKY